MWRGAGILMVHRDLVVCSMVHSPGSRIKSLGADGKCTPRSFAVFGVSFPQLKNKCFLNPSQFAFLRFVGPSRFTRESFLIPPVPFLLVNVTVI
jgi:hypothetical protein